MAIVTSFQASFRRASIQTSQAIPRHSCSKYSVPLSLPLQVTPRPIHASSSLTVAAIPGHTAVAPCDQEAEDLQHMAVALKLAEKAARLGEVPVGAVLVSGSRILSRAHNLVESRNDPTAHAEMLAIRQAAMRQGGRWPLREATLYVTLEPCAMCAGAILLARVGTVVYGARSTLLGADGSWASLFPPAAAAGQRAAVAGPPCCAQEGAAEPASGASLRPHATHPDLQVRRGVLAGECAALMQRFFQQRRLENKAMDSKERTAAAPTLWKSLKRFFVAAFHRL